MADTTTEFAADGSEAVVRLRALISHLPPGQLHKDLDAMAEFVIAERAAGWSAKQTLAEDVERLWARVNRAEDEVARLNAILSPPMGHGFLNSRDPIHMDGSSVPDNR